MTTSRRSSFVRLCVPEGRFVSSGHYGDLVETVTGYFHADDGTKHPTMLQIAETRIGDAKRRIDAFLWFNGKSSRLTGAIINQDDSERMQRLCALLHINPRSIET
jgi:hypothetical protein